MKAIWSFAFAATLVSTIRSQTTSCGTSSAICANTTYFYTCVDFGNGTATPEGDPDPCPPSTICVASSSAVCEACNAGGWACADETHFVECVVGPGGGEEPLGEPELCQGGLVCSSDGLGVACVQQEETTTMLTTTVAPTTTELTTPSPTTTTPTTTTPTTTTPTTTTPTTTTPTTTTPTTTTPTTTTTTPTTTTATPTSPQPFVCTSSGKFPDPANCSSYFICSVLTAGGWFQSNYTCPGGSVFNQVIGAGRCELPGSVVCPTPSTSPTLATALVTSPTTKTTTTTSRPCLDTFTCTAQGRFSAPCDCFSYYSCSTMTSGGFLQSLYMCPESSWFDAVSTRCSTVAPAPTACT